MRPDNGKMVFDSIPELYYDLLMEIGLAVKDQYIYIQGGNFLKCGDKFIKVSLDGSPIYPGRNDIIFDPPNNYALISFLFGYYLDQCQDSEDGDILQGYIAHYIDDDSAREKQRVVVQTRGRGELCSNFYYNIYLAYIDCIFTIAGYNVDLSNFDVKPTIIIGRRKR
jgi:hypothetical protein